MNNDDGHFWLVLLHTISITIQGTINSVVYCIDEDIFYQCTPSGIKTGVSMLFSKKQRETVKIQKYAMRLDEDISDSEGEGKLKNVSLE